MRVCDQSSLRITGNLGAHLRRTCTVPRKSCHLINVIWLKFLPIINVRDRDRWAGEFLCLFCCTRCLFTIGDLVQARVVSKIDSRQIASGTMREKIAFTVMYTLWFWFCTDRPRKAGVVPLLEFHIQMSISEFRKNPNFYFRLRSWSIRDQ